MKHILVLQAAKQQFIQAWNKHIGRINYQQQKQAKAQEAAFWAQLYNNNPIIRECLDTLAMSKAMGE